MKKLTTILLLAGLSLGSTALAQKGFIPHNRLSYELDTRKKETPQETPDKGEEALLFEEVISAPNAPWLRLHFNDYNLPEGSRLKISSLVDDSVQHFDQESLDTWGGHSAYFNGESVLLQLYGTAQAKDAYLSLKSITAGGPDPDQKAAKAICGNTDDRVPSSDARIGRLRIPTSDGTSVCTGWLVSTGAMLTAGHCFQDETLNSSVILEFNVPNSASDGTMNVAPANDQYPLNLWAWYREGNYAGKDFAVFNTGANSNTNLTPHEAQSGFFRMTRSEPNKDDTVRVTGFGADSNDNVRNFTQQTHLGPYKDEDSKGGFLKYDYQVDTEGGNSGSPVIRNVSSGVLGTYAIGIHTKGGCPVITEQGNHGASFETDRLENMVTNFAGNNWDVFMSGNPLGSNGGGDAFDPIQNLDNAVNKLPSGGGTLGMVRGSYPKPSSGNYVIGNQGRQIFFDLPVGGSVVIGD